MLSQIAWEIGAKDVGRGEKNSLKPLQDIYKDSLKSTTFLDGKFPKLKSLDKKKFHYRIGFLYFLKEILAVYLTTSPIASSIFLKNSGAANFMWSSFPRKDFYPEEKNPISSVVTEILSFRLTDGRTDIKLLCIID